jgi:arylsulfatase A-like enzyme
LITFQDLQVGRLMQFLKDNDLEGNTVVLFTADHGDLMGDFGCFFKSNFLNGSVRVPLILRSPGQMPAGVNSDQLVGLQDVLPTLASLAGVPLEQQVDGADLSALAADPEHTVRPYYVAQCGNDPRQSYMIFDGRYKYIYSQWDGVEELYDEQEDPKELQNLAGQSSSKSRLSDMRNLLIEWCKKNDDPEMLDDGNLKRSSLDPEALRRPMQGFMGWRPF